MTAVQFEQEIEAAAQARESLRAWRTDAGLQRRFAEDWLLSEALADEAERLALPDPRVDVRADVLVAVVERQLDSALEEPAPAAIEAFLDAHRAQVVGAEKLRLRHVFRRLPRQADAAMRAQAREVLEDLRGRILAGADMGALARAHSDSETAKFDGLMTPIARGQLPRSVEAIVWALAPGELSPVVDTTVGPHIFRLEGRQAAEPLTDAQAQAWARLRLLGEARQAARARAFEHWLQASGAEYHPERLEAVGAEPTEVVFRLGSTRLTRADLVQRQAELPFGQRRNTRLAELLAGAAWRVLALWQAERLVLSERPEVRRESRQAERAAWARLAFERRAAATRAALPEDVLRAFFATAPERYGDPARERLRVIVRRPAEGQTMSSAYDALAALLADLRAGRESFESAAQRSSQDPSAAQAGALGFVAPRDLQAWAGPTFAARVAALAPGDIGGPLLAERYEEQQLAYVPAAYVLVRVEERRTPPSPRFEDVREQVALAYAAARPFEVQEHLRSTLLRAWQVQVRLGEDGLTGQ